MTCAYLFTSNLSTIWWYAATKCTIYVINCLPRPPRKSSIGNFSSKDRQAGNGNREIVSQRYIHTYMHTCIHTYIQTCIQTCVHTNIHTSIHTCIHAFVHTYIHACLHTYKPTWIHVYMQPHMTSLLAAELTEMRAAAVYPAVMGGSHPITVYIASERNYSVSILSCSLC